jgi:parvulin-like peptidyl-prolyl isomerase
MARNPRRTQPIVSKKHLARMQREQRQARYITITAIFVIVAVIGLIGYGVLNENVLKFLQPVAIVNGDKVTVGDFEAQVRFNRKNLVDSAASTYQFAQMFGNNPQFQSSAASQLFQIQTQLEPQTIGNQVLEQMVQDKLIRQEAKRRNIAVGKQELDKALQEAFGYFAQGTLTPEPTLVEKPTSTLSPLQMTLSAPGPTITPTMAITPTVTLGPTATPTATMTTTPIPTETLIPTITPTSEPTATPTEYTLEGYNNLYKQSADKLKTDINFSEKDIRYVIESQLYRKKVMDAVLGEMNLAPAEEQVWARHILVPDEATAKIVESRIADGEDWSQLAALFSTDTSNKDSGGDLGWFARGRMVAEFEDAAFKLGVGEISQPVQTSFGWHIIQVLGHEMRPLSQSDFDQLRPKRFSDWLTELRGKSQVEIKDIWQQIVPTEPVFPTEIETFLQQVQQQMLQQTQPGTTAP